MPFHTNSPRRNDESFLGTSSQASMSDSSLLDPTSVSPVQCCTSTPHNARSAPLWEEFLTVPDVAYKAKKCVPGEARVLTSVEYMKMAVEKERKKIQAALEKGKKNERRRKYLQKKRNWLNKSVKESKRRALFF